ncbi:hypothetical protein C8R46DRAFT_1041559 [Mycena filopes]|nr:hypothetical protein C8R46DRAFT_1041559 [Mycena filopes]
MTEFTGVTSPDIDYSPSLELYECYNNFQHVNSDDHHLPEYESAPDEATCGNDDGCMETAYGEVGYWEEYHRRRYEIIYGDDMDRSLAGAPAETGMYATESDDAVATPWTFAKLQAAYESSVLEEREEYAYLIERWKETEAAGYVWDAQMGEWLPPEPSDPAEAPPWTLAELQAEYDSADLDDKLREEYGETLERWRAAEAAGYVWDTRTGKWARVEPQEDHSFLSLSHLPSGQVHHIAELPLSFSAKSTTGSSASPTPPPTKSSDLARSTRSTTKASSQKSPRKSPIRRKELKPRALLRPRRRGQSARVKPLRAVRSGHHSAGVTMCPACGTTPPSVGDDRRCSPHTVPIVSAVVHRPREPVPPDIPADAAFLKSRRRPYSIAIPRVAKPPDILADVAFLASSRRSFSVGIPRAPNSPDVHHIPVVSGTATNSEESISAQRRRNALRRLAKKGKG